MGQPADLPAGRRGPRPPLTLGLLALGDSITAARGSWASWVAAGLELPIRNEAEDGALIDDVLARQLGPEGRYELGCLYVGSNDARTLGWDVARFEAGYRRTLDFLDERCDRTLCVTIPLDLGRPPAGAKVEQANRAIERVAAARGALVLDLRGLRGRKLLMADHVHPTPRGQRAIGDRALALLAADGLPARAALAPRDEGTRASRLRDDAAYAYAHAKVSARAAALAAFFRLRPG